MDTNYWAFEHGDDMEIIVTPQDQIKATRGDMGNCAVVVALRRTNTKTVYNAKVRQGDILVYARNERGEAWVFRFVMDRATRELAKGFDAGKFWNQDVKISMRFDKRWQLVESEKPQKDKELVSAKPKSRQRSETVTLESQTQTFRPKGVTVGRPRKQRRTATSRWDPMYYTNHQTNRQA